MQRTPMKFCSIQAGAGEVGTVKAGAADTHVPKVGAAQVAVADIEEMVRQPV